MTLIAIAIWPEFIEMWHTQDYFGVPGVFTAPWWPIKLVIFLSAALCTIIFVLKVLAPRPQAGPDPRTRTRGRIMSPIEIGLASVVAIVVLIYLGALHPDRAGRGLVRVDLADARQFRRWR